MTSAISGAHAPQAQAITVNGAAKASSAKPTSKVDGDGDNDASMQAAASKTKVTISAAAQLAAAANKEALETPAQTAQEARGSDMQAKRLMAKEQATSAAAEA